MPPPPVCVDEGWLKPVCGEHIEHMFACVYVCVYCALCANYLSYPVLLAQSLKYNLEDPFFFNRSSEQMAPYFASSSNTNQWKIKKVSQRIPPPQVFLYVTAALSSPGPSLLFNFLYVYLLFLSRALPTLPSPLMSSRFPLSHSCIDRALLCLRELASKLSAASGLKAISSASLPLQVCAWDW